MANYSTGTATGPGATDNFMVALGAALTANGWTVLDTLIATVGSRDIVYRSTPLDATALNYCYLRIKQYSVNTFGWNIYTDWDTSTHTGILETGTSGSATTTLSDSSFVYFFRINAYSCSVCVKISGTYYKGYAGFVRRGLPASKAGMTRSTSAYAIGAGSMAVASDMTGKLKVGQRVMIYNHAGSSASANAPNAEVMTIQTIAVGTLTFTGTTTKAYDIGAVIGQLAFPGILSNGIVSTNTWAGVTVYRPFALDGLRSGGTSHPATPIQQILVTEANADPGDIYPEYASGLVGISTSEASRTGFIGYMYSWECAASGSQSLEDIMDDGDNTYIVLALNSTTDVMLLGPQ